MLSPPRTSKNPEEVAHHSWDQIPKFATQAAYLHLSDLGRLWTPSYVCSGGSLQGRRPTGIVLWQHRTHIQRATSSGAQLPRWYPIHPPELRGDPQKSVRSPEHHSSGLTLTLLPQAEGVKAEPFENHSALEIAEQLTLLDHLVFKKIPYE